MKHAKTNQNERTSPLKVNFTAPADAPEEKKEIARLMDGHETYITSYCPTHKVGVVVIVGPGLGLDVACLDNNLVAVAEKFLEEVATDLIGKTHDAGNN